MSFLRKHSRDHLHTDRRSCSFHRRLRVESLEDRRMLATFIVGANTDADLRGAINSANSNAGLDTIVFQNAGSILLTSGELVISEGLEIRGPTAGGITIDAQQNSRIFNFTDTMGDLILENLTLQNGRDTSNLFFSIGGGAVRFASSDTLTLDNTTITGSSTVGDDAGGGGIFSEGNLTLIDSTISHNTTQGDLAHGGGIYVHNGDVSLTNSTVNDNATVIAVSFGGGIYAAHGNVTLTNSTVSANSTSGISGFGGGIFAGDGNVSLSDSTVSGNTTLGPFAHGGGILAGGDVSLMDRSFVIDNIGTGNGGGIYSPNGHVYSDDASRVASNRSGFSGGGIFAGRVTLTSNSLVLGNISEGGGGGGIFSFGDVDVLMSLVVGNMSDGDGGGIFAGTGTVRLLSSSSVEANSTTSNGARGGGIATTSGAVFLEANSRVNRNINVGNGSNIGGGISTVSGPISVSDGSFVNGNMTSNEGGGIHTSSGTITVTSSTVSSNSTSGPGGGIFSGSMPVEIISSTISGNSSFESFGGGIYNNDGNVNLTNSTISGNTAADGGGGIFSNGGNLSLMNSTVVFNTESGIDVSNSSGNLTIRNTIVYQDATIPDPDIARGFPDPTINFSLIGVFPPGPIQGNIGNITGPPLLDILRNNGGRTQTHALFLGSLAIDAGQPSFVSPPAEDQRGPGFDRVANGGSAMIIDIGAFESQGEPPPPPPPGLSGDINSDGFVNAADFTGFRDTLGTTGLTPNTGADGNGNGEVDPDDFNVFVANFGASLSSGLTSTVTTQPAIAQLTDGAAVLDSEESTDAISDMRAVEAPLAFFPDALLRPSLRPALSPVEQAPLSSNTQQETLLLLTALTPANIDDAVVEAFDARVDSSNETDEVDDDLLDIVFSAI